ncbi:hypothetical protein FA95DRAFT_1595416 [Auriscalpium vulgare]|uniref:Uncharacterized protein n=1 Tax=Auriscalpium vulgare TaxID=40419 RepID=A0ACB8RVN0_9AGAM|nr:hypothetical protein FA95DRAFT_1595416 [Auriscalpium vulgare]
MPSILASLPGTINPILAEGLRFFEEAMAQFASTLSDLHRQVDANEAILAQQRGFLTHDCNVKHYLTHSMESLRCLEQNINATIAEVLCWNPLAEPNVGTDLREAVPAKFRSLPYFPAAPSTPSVRAERAAASAELIASVGMSAHRPWPLTSHDFPRNPAIAPPDWACGDKKIEVILAAIPPYGEPKWAQPPPPPPKKTPQQWDEEVKRYRPSSQNSLRDRTALGLPPAFTPPQSGRSSPYPPEQHYAPSGHRYADDLEGQNDEALEGLSSKVRMLKDLSVGIGNEVRESAIQLTQMNDAFAETSGILGGTFRRMNNMAARQGCRWLWYIVFLFVVFWFFLVVWWFRR